MIRRTSKLLVATSLALAMVALPTTAQAQEEADTAQLSAQEIVAAMQPGWNLGNTLDAMCCSPGADETAWGNPRVDPSFFDDIKAEGFNSVRIPVSWGTRTGPAPDYTIEPATMARVQEIVDYALDADLYVMINTHHDSWQWIEHIAEPEQHDAVMAQYTATWTQIADSFKDYPQELMFEPVNEVGFGGWGPGTDKDHELIAELNSSFHEIVRASGGDNADRLLVLPTIRTGSDPGDMDALAAEIEALDDPMLAATTHNYGFYPFSANLAGYPSYNEEVQNFLEEDFQRQVDTFVSQGIPVIIGEYSLHDNYENRVERGEALKFFEHFGYLARTSGITTMWWDNGRHYDRYKRQWRDQEQFDYISTAWTTRSGTASTDNVFVDASDKIQDQSVTLNLNGLEFEKLKYGNTTLQAGKDYTLDGTTLTIRAKLLKSVLDDREIGSSGQLTVHFSAGMPWKLNFINSEDVVIEGATGTNAGLAIPAAFNGDKLSMMESVYADGTAAGSIAWTTFPGFWEDFRPDYENGTILLTKLYLDSLKDGEQAYLTFHFWSGQTLQYTVTRNGTAVTGVL
ncbi:cellulase family glycosylhydrolase [Agromyces albus]|uniref:cellulase family glycosylhydrolase n=1 Tax=Agromyces albus TaxID=205332 RepID=UPI002783E738|nr:cellulase family glycosylhydrolase [Agromyces albus]MDQ0577415.1 endoglucanase [Agromyces albus]